MLRCHHHSLFPNISSPLFLRHSPSLSLYKPTSLSPRPAVPRARLDTWLAELPETVAATTNLPEEGPIELFQSTPSIFATSDNPSPLQVATSVLLTGAIAVFLFRSLRRRAKRAKELKFRSTGVKKSLQEEALDNLKAISSGSIEATGPPSPAQTLLGALAAGAISLILYKFTTTIEAALNQQAMSDNFSARQITITIRTIINGLCYLATFVFGINSIGLFFYSGQLAINSIMEGFTDETKNKDQSGSPNATTENLPDSAELNSNQGQSVDDSQ